MKKTLSLVLIIVLTQAFLMIPSKLLAQGPLVGPTSGKLAVTPAGYDDMKAVLDGMGVQSEEISLDDLGNLEKLKTYSAVYINCSFSVDSVAETAAESVKQYVQSGGVIYASDYANSLIEKAFPGKISFYQGEEQSSMPGMGARVGNSGRQTGKVVDPGMAAVLGKNTIEINFDLGAWVVMEQASGQVYIKGPAPIVDFSAISGSLGDLQNIDFNNPQALQDLQNKIQTEKTLEDVPYVVSFAEGDGEVLYTSFHNEAQTTEDVSKVLNWFATRTAASSLTQSAREMATDDKQVLLEIVDSLNKNQTKTFKFNATGKADFTAVLNFGGSSLEITIKDPSGKTVSRDTVSSPPYKKTISKPASGKYSFEIKGKDIPRNNYPFVLSIVGKSQAAGDQAGLFGKTSQGITFLRTNLFWSIILGVGILFVIILVILIIVFVLIRRKSKEKPIAINQS